MSQNSQNRCLLVAQFLYRVDAARATRRNPDGQQGYSAQ